MASSGDGMAFSRYYGPSMALLWLFYGFVHLAVCAQVCPSVPKCAHGVPNCAHVCPSEVGIDRGNSSTGTLLPDGLPSKIKSNFSFFRSCGKNTTLV